MRGGTTERESGPAFWQGSKEATARLMKRYGGARHAVLLSSEAAYAFACIAGSARRASVLLSISDYRLIADGAARSAPRILAPEQ